jgi:hypothetical protein
MGRMRLVFSMYERASLFLYEATPAPGVVDVFGQTHV